MNNIYLVGYMGSGKSTIGKCINEIKKMNLIEMDEIISKKEGKTITEIFNNEGENYFRRKETELLKQIGKLKNVVISCGGGVCLRNENIGQMKLDGVVVFLRANENTILERVTRTNDRPLLEGHKNLEYIKKMMVKREPSYMMAADIVIDVDNKLPIDVANEILNKIRNYKRDYQSLYLIGTPVTHSISPSMHNEACKVLNLNYKYFALDVNEDEVEEIIDKFKKNNVRGFNVTMPCKNIIPSLCDDLSLSSKISRSCNTVLIDGDRLYGTTTDGIGFINALKEYGQEIKEKEITVLGAGGAATSIVVACALKGAKKINIFNSKSKNYERMLNIIEDLNKQCSCDLTLSTYSDDALRNSVLNSSILVNCTPVGMGNDVNLSIIKDVSMLHSGLFVFDTIYNPRCTKLMKDAQNMNIECANGLMMLLHQGAESFKMWTNEQMPINFIKEKCFDEDSYS